MWRRVGNDDSGSDQQTITDRGRAANYRGRAKQPAEAYRHRDTSADGHADPHKHARTDRNANSDEAANTHSYIYTVGDAYAPGDEHESCNTSDQKLQ